MSFQVIQPEFFNNQLYVATSAGTYVAPLSNAIKDLSFSKSEFGLIRNSEGQNWHLDEVNHQLLLGHNNGSFLIKNNEAIQLTPDRGAWLFVPTTSVFPAKNVLVGEPMPGLRCLNFRIINM